MKMSDRRKLLVHRMMNESESVPLLWISALFTSLKPKEFKEIQDVVHHIGGIAWESGWAPISSHKNSCGYGNLNLDYNEWMVRMGSQILRCDAVLLLPGWEKSNGCLAEYEFAKMNNMPTHEFEKVGIPVPKLKVRENTHYDLE